MEDIFGVNLISQGGVVRTSTLHNYRIVLVLASASWCPTCHQFLPRLIDFYRAVNSSGKIMEIVFVSRDKKVDEFNNIVRNVPWVAMNFDQRRAEAVFQRFGISGIPKLILLNQNGAPVRMECREDILANGPGCIEIWRNLLD
ncbi:unnamed protein product [Blepharisma stoltei]|uniref:Thioredoxin domain-containing protein n=1 Tax=Blepharisma stoltei TaxID=1481888 RepID=A0AAU9JTD4_9CILI|nr:unnamed protein product [Blepharisma stoltei]